MNWKIIGYFTYNPNDIRGLEIYDLYQKKEPLKDYHKSYLLQSYIIISKLSELRNHYIGKKWFYDFIYTFNEDFKISKYTDPTDTDFNEEYENKVINYINSASELIEEIFGREIKVSNNIIELNDSDINYDKTLTKIKDIIDNSNLDDSYKVRAFPGQDLSILFNINQELDWNYFDLKSLDELYPKYDVLFLKSKDRYTHVKFLNIDIDKDELKDENYIYKLYEDGIIKSHLSYTKANGFYKMLDQFIKIDDGKKYELELNGIKNELIKIENIIPDNDLIDQCYNLLNLDENLCNEFVYDMENNESNFLKYFENEKIFEYYNFLSHLNMDTCVELIEKILDKLNFYKYESDKYFFPVNYGNAVNTEILLNLFHKKKLKYYQNFEMWCLHCNLSEKIKNSEILKVFFNNCIEFINGIIFYLNPEINNINEIVNQNYIRIEMSLFKRNSTLAIDFYKSLNTLFLKQYLLYQNTIKKKKSEIKLKVNNINISGIISSYKDTKNDTLLQILNNLLNAN